MPLVDFVKLVKRKIKLIIGIPVVCALAALLLTFVFPLSNLVTASFVTSGDATLALGYANSAISSNATRGVELSASLNATSKQVSVTAKGPDAGACVTAANSIVDSAAKKIQADGGKATITAADSSSNASASVVKRIATAFLGGLIIALCVVIIGDAIRSPIKSQKDAEGVSNLPVLGSTFGENGGEKLLANLQFRCGGIPSSIAIVTAGLEGTGALIARELGQELELAGVRVRIVRGSAHARKFKVSIPENATVIVDCAPLDEGMGAAYIAHDAKTTLLCVTEWETTRSQLASTLEELKLAKADIAGIAYAVLKTPKRKGFMRRARK